MIPNPGSPEAVDAGCACAPHTNNHGHGVMIRGQIKFWRNEDCELHGADDVMDLTTEAGVFF